MRDFFEEFGFLFVIAALIIVIFACVAGVAYVTGKFECEAKTAQIGFDHRYLFLGGCQIEVTPNQWIPLDSYYFKQE